MVDFRIEHFDCACLDYDHSMRVHFDPDETDIRALEIYIDHVWPPQYGFWRRLCAAIKYVWNGKRSWTYGTINLEYNQVVRLRRILAEYDLAVWRLRKANKDDDNNTTGL